MYCEMTEEGHVAEVSLELLSKGRKLANDLGVKLEALAIGHQLDGVPAEVFPFGTDVVHLADDKRLFPFNTLPHAAITVKLFEAEQPEIALFGATSVGRDLAPRVASALKCGLTADCTSLEIGDHTEPKSQKVYKNLLYQSGRLLAEISCHHHQPAAPAADGDRARRCHEKRNGTRQA